MNQDLIGRRAFLKVGAVAAASLAATKAADAAGWSDDEAAPLLKISLAQWSLHRMLRAGDLAALEFPSFTREKFDLDAVEYVNQFFKDQAKDDAFLGDLKRRCDDAGVRSLLIMVDGEGSLGHPDEAERTKAIENHHQWVEAAKKLDCHSIRVNAHSWGEREEQARLAADGLRRLTDFADPYAVNVIVENHGGLSSDGSWLAGVIQRVDHPRCGTLPDFGNFHLGEGKWYDRYKGVEELMPFAKAVSAKSHAFDERGEETNTDFSRMMRIVLDAGYRGYVGIEYEGGGLSEVEGVVATKSLLERTRESLASEFG
ncbi:MAG: sugar phosphate isomerase/epimerase family protein [Phycisphaerales bacterium]